MPPAWVGGLFGLQWSPGGGAKVAVFGRFAVALVALPFAWMPMTALDPGPVFGDVPDAAVAGGLYIFLREDR